MTCSRAGLEAETRTQGSGPLAQSISHWITLPIGQWKCNSHNSRWKAYSYWNTRLQTSSCIKTLLMILIGKLPKLVKDGREARKKELKQSLSHHKWGSNSTVALSTHWRLSSCHCFTGTMRTPSPNCTAAWVFEGISKRNFLSGISNFSRAHVMHSLMLYQVTTLPPCIHSPMSSPGPQKPPIPLLVTILPNQVSFASFWTLNIRNQKNQNHNLVPVFFSSTLCLRESHFVACKRFFIVLM